MTQKIDTSLLNGVTMTTKHCGFRFRRPAFQQMPGNVLQPKRGLIYKLVNGLRSGLEIIHWDFLHRKKDSDDPQQSPSQRNGHDGIAQPQLGQAEWQGLAQRLRRAGADAEEWRTS